MLLKFLVLFFILIFAFDKILFFYIADLSKYIDNIFLVEFLQVFHNVLNFGFFIILYYILKPFNNKALSKFLKNWRTNPKTQISIFALTFFLIPVIACLIATLRFNFAGILYVIIPLILYFFFAVPIGIIVLYLIWGLIDVISYICRKQNNKVISDNLRCDVNIVEPLPDIRKFSSFLFVILSVFTNQIFFILNMFYLKKQLNCLAIHSKKISDKNIYIIIMTGLLVVISSFSLSFLEKRWVLIFPLTDCVITSIYFLLGLLYIFVIYYFVDKSLKIIEDYSKNKYHCELIHDRFFAFLFGLLYLNYAINSYQDRVADRLLTEKFVKIPNILYKIILVLAFLIVAFVISCIIE